MPKGRKTREFKRTEVELSLNEVHEALRDYLRIDMEIPIDVSLRFDDERKPKGIAVAWNEPLSGG